MTLGAFLTVALIHLAAAMSPGPSFVVAARTAATDGFGTACALALGFGLGAALWALAAMAGLIGSTGELRWNDRPIEDPEVELRPGRVAHVAQVPRVLSGTFRGNVALDHADRRVEPAVEAARLGPDVTEAGGVAYVNDSKATNVDSAAKALSAFRNIRWICGGLQKDGGLEGLAPGLANVAKAYVIGREAAGFALGLPGIEAEVCTEMSTAVEHAMAEAQPGETVLLAPAAASFDQYDNFEQRGVDFTQNVLARLPQA